MYVCICKMVFARRYAVEERRELPTGANTHYVCCLSLPNVGGRIACVLVSARRACAVLELFLHGLGVPLRVLGSCVGCTSYGIQVSAHVTAAG
jgi:hypothetical protein